MDKNDLVTAGLGAAFLVVLICWLVVSMSAQYLTQDIRTTEPIVLRNITYQCDVIFDPYED